MLSLIELQNKKVEAKRKKYEKDEMDEYLEVIFDNYKQLLEENQKLQAQKVEQDKQMKKLSDGIQYYRSIETTLQKALILAEKTSKETKDAAILKAESIEKEAHKRADKIINNAEDEYSKLRNKCLRLAQQFNAYKIQLKEAASAQLQLIDGKEFDISNPEDINTIKKETKQVEIVIDKSSTPSKPKHSEPIIIKQEKKPDNMSDTSRLEILSADTIDLRDTLEAVNSQEEEVAKDATPSVKQTEPASFVEPAQVKTIQPMEIHFDEDKKEQTSQTEPKTEVVAAPEPVKQETVKTEPAKQESVKPEPIKQDTPAESSNDLVEDTSNTREESIDTSSQNKESDSVPTLDSLLQDLNINNRSNQKSDDPFEFLGSVDDF